MKKLLSLFICGSFISSPLSKASASTSAIFQQHLGFEQSSTMHLKDHYATTRMVVSEYSGENQEVLKTLNLFLSDLDAAYSAGQGLIDKDILCILEAIKFAAKKHQHQTRKDPQATPYIIHPVGVANYLLTLGKVRDPDILIGALLHDTVEDTETSFEDIRILFGPRVEGFVREVTDDRSLTRAERKASQITHAPSKSAGGAQIKLADKLYNLNDLFNAPPTDWSRTTINEYFDWAEKVVQALPWVNAALLNAVDQTITNYRLKHNSE